MTGPTHFETKEHKIESCHIREYAGSTINQEEILHLHVKQYTPLDNAKAQPLTKDAVTIIATHGTGIPKVRSMIVSTFYYANTITGALRAFVG